MVAIPLFVVRPVAWTAPDPSSIDALLLTSANAVRHGGGALTELSALPVVAVGAATAAAARAAGFTVVEFGATDAAAALTLARARGFSRILHPAGRDRIALEGVVAITVYASDIVDVPPGVARRMADRIVLLHSVRAARRVAALIDRDRVARATVSIAALSPAVAAAVGDGWRTVLVAARPDDDALFAAIESRD